MLRWSDALKQDALALDAQRFAALRVQHIASIDSTNSALLRAAQQGDYAPQVVWADVQSAGRGRMGRQWQGAGQEDGAQQRSLSFSLALPFAPQDWSGLSLVVGLAAAQTLAPDIALKWPNDLCLRQADQVDGGYAKLGGILLETQALPDSLPAPWLGASSAARWLVIGLGLNVQGLPTAADLRAPAVDLAAVLPPSQLQAYLADMGTLCRQLAQAILQAILRFERSGFAPFADDFAARDLLLGQALATYSEQGWGAGGIGLGVGADGSYRLRQADGQLQAIHSAEISLRPQAWADAPQLS